MERCAGKAVAAGIAPDEAADMLRGLGYETVIVNDAAQALKLCMDGADIVVADAILPVMDGFALAKRIRALGCMRLPGVVVTHLPGMGRKLNLPGTAALQKPFDMKMLGNAVNEVGVRLRRPDDELNGRIEALLDMLGVRGNPGRRYIADAVFLAHEDQGMLMRLTGELYPAVAARQGTDARAVERAMRKAIDDAWNSGSIDAQYEIFKNTIDAARGKPTCGGMTARLAEMLRREDVV